MHFFTFKRWVELNSVILLNWIRIRLYQTVWIRIQINGFGAKIFSYIHIVLFVPAAFTHFINYVTISWPDSKYTVYPGSSHPFHKVSYYMKWAITAWTYSSGSMCAP